MKRMNGVHTRIGLTLTALSEIAASTITSLSVCSLMRFKVTMVPWYAYTISLRVLCSHAKMSGVFFLLSSSLLERRTCSIWY